MGRELKPYDDINAYADAPSSPAETIDLRRLMVALRRQRTTIILPAVLLGGLGLVYAVSKPETFTTYSSMLLDNNINQSVQQAGGITAVAPVERIENARVVLGSAKLAGDVLDKTGLEENPSFMNPPRSAVASAIGRVISTLLAPVRWIIDLVTPADVVETTELAPSLNESDPLIVQLDPKRRLAMYRLQGGMRVDRIGQSSAVAISYSSNDPVIAAQVANAYADLYVQDLLTSNAGSIGQTNSWMQGRLDELRDQAQEAAGAAERFAAENGLVEFSSGGLLTEQALNELNSSLTAVLTEAARARAVLDTYDRAVAGGIEGLTNSNSSLAIGGDISVELRARLDSYNDVQARLQRLLSTSGPNHPQVAGLQQTLITTAERLFVELQAKRAEAQSTLDVANARVEALQQSVQKASERNSDQAANFVRLRALQNEASTMSTIYQQTLTRSQEIEQQQSFPVSNVRILSYAQVPSAPSGPAVLRTALAATLLGVFIGMAIAALREWRERSLRTAADVTDYSDLRFLGHLPVLPTVRRARTEGAASETEAEPVSNRVTGEETLPALSKARYPIIKTPVPVLHYPNSVYAETLRHVRLAGEGSGGVLPVTGVTSFHPFKGRSSVALNLAGQLSIGMHSVLLIDADTRGRALTRMLGLENEPGLTDAVSGRGHWKEMLVSIADTNVVVLPCGMDHGGPSDDLLTGQMLAQITAEAQEGDFDRVVVDVPPLYPVAQGRAILHDLPQFVIVGEWGQTSRSMAETALAEDQRLEARCLGVVYDRVNMRKLRAFLLPGEMENYLDGSKSDMPLWRRITRRFGFRSL